MKRIVRVLLLWSIFSASALAISSGSLAQIASPSIAKAVHSIEFFLGFLFGYDTHVLDSDERRGIQVIGAGASRTGTKSIEQALMMMGHKIYDTRSVLQHRHAARWKQAAEEWKYRNRTGVLNDLVHDMEELGYTATLDFPLFLFAVPISELRPHGKVLLSVRDSPDAWFKSFQYIYEKAATGTFCRPWSWAVAGQAFEMVEMSSSILKATHDIDFRYLEYPQDKVRYFPWYEKLRPIDDNHPNLRKDKNIKMYVDNIEYVKAAVPKDNLLVYNVKEGWGPWVDFFSIRDPSLTAEDFPFVNDRTTLDVLASIVDYVGLLLPVWVLLALRTAYVVLAGFSSRGRLPSAKSKIS
jgi:Sulfotransferase domain